MRKLLWVFLWLVTSPAWAFDPSKWNTSTEVLTAKGVPVYPVFLNTYTGDGVTTPWNGKLFTRGAWTRVDLSAHLPADAKSVFLTGILIITHGTNVETADLTINLKPPSSPENPGNYEGQVIETMTFGGQRSPFASWVSVEDGKFDFYWNAPIQGAWPDWSSYGVSLQLQAFTR